MMIIALALVSLINQLTLEQQSPLESRSFGQTFPQTESPRSPKLTRLIGVWFMMILSFLESHFHKWQTLKHVIFTWIPSSFPVSTLEWVETTRNCITSALLPCLELHYLKILDEPRIVVGVYLFFLSSPLHHLLFCPCCRRQLKTIMICTHWAKEECQIVCTSPTIQVKFNYFVRQN